MSDDTLETLQEPERRRLMGLAALTFVVGAALAGGAHAAANASKADVKYQFMPKGSARCGLCASFIPPGGGVSGPGTCKIVEGPIPQDGWCVLFSPR